MSSDLRAFAAREAQHEPAPRHARVMRRCECGRVHEATAGERTCEDCAEAEVTELRDIADFARLDWPGVGRGE